MLLNLYLNKPKKITPRKIIGNSRIFCRFAPIFIPNVAGVGPTNPMAIEMAKRAARMAQLKAFEKTQRERLNSSFDTPKSPHPSPETPPVRPPVRYSSYGQAIHEESNRRKLAILEKNKDPIAFVTSLWKNSRNKPQNTPPPQPSIKTCATDQEIWDHESKYGVKLTKMIMPKRKSHPINGHLARVDQKTGEANAYTHSRMCDENGKDTTPVVCYGDHAGQEAYQTIKNRIQRVVTNPVSPKIRLTPLNWVERRRIDIENLKCIEEMHIIMKIDPKGFQEFQTFTTWFHRDSSLNCAEKSKFLKEVCADFRKQYNL